MIVSPSSPQKVIIVFFNGTNAAVFITLLLPHVKNLLLFVFVENLYKSVIVNKSRPTCGRPSRSQVYDIGDYPGRDTDC